MCMEDIRLGRQLATGYPQSMPVTVVRAQVARPDPNRTRIAFATNATQTVFLSVGPVGNPEGYVWTLTPTHPGYVFTVEEWGKMVTDAWNAESGAGALNVWVTEQTLEKQ